MVKDRRSGPGMPFLESNTCAEGGGCYLFLSGFSSLYDAIHGWMTGRMDGKSFTTTKSFTICNVIYTIFGRERYFDTYFELTSCHFSRVLNFIPWYIFLIYGVFFNKALQNFVRERESKRHLCFSEESDFVHYATCTFASTSQPHSLNKTLITHTSSLETILHLHVSLKLLPNHNTVIHKSISLELD
jgi:hypothetical protein